MEEGYERRLRLHEEAQDLIKRIGEELRTCDEKREFILVNSEIFRNKNSERDKGCNENLRKTLSFAKKLKGLSDGVVDRFIHNKGEENLRKREPYWAFKAFRLIDDREGIKRAGELALSEEDRSEDARMCFSYLGDRQGLLKVAYVELKRYGIEDPTFVTAAYDYIGSATVQKVTALAHDWARLRADGLDEFPDSNLINRIMLAHSTSHDYDIGIAVARGGLSLAHMYSLFGLDIKIVHVKRCGRGASVRYIDSITYEDIHDKRVLVIEDDVVTGRTSSKAYKELKKHSPKELSIVLSNGVEYGPNHHGLKTNACNIPDGYDRFYHHEALGPECFEAAACRLEQILHGQA